MDVECRPTHIYPGYLSLLEWAKPEIEFFSRCNSYKMPFKMCFFKTSKNTTSFISFKNKISIWIIWNLIHINQQSCVLKETYNNYNISWSLLFPGSLKWYVLLTLDCGRCSRVGSGGFGVSFVSAFSVTARVGGTGALSQAGTQGRQGGWHALVVVHPDEPIKAEKCSFHTA